MGILRFVIRAFFSAPRHPPVPRDRPRSPAERQRQKPPPRRVHYEAAAVTVIERARTSHDHAVLKGKCHVIDGDTIVIGKVRIRIAGIDAPELDHPWGQKSKWALVGMCRGQVITAHIRDELSYGRVVASCHLPDGRDLAAELVKLGLALDWPKFSGGAYRHLEPPDARRKLWRANARQKGRMPPA
ncbi:nuclease-like protein [Roseovarius halotolerans]|uniref:Succinoglycan biosynthesis protein ExoI n=1 Tax=Roseovarius halotolerans TaxID=505353 RepID=A0A1X6YTJ9_9RHOB|nr:thermonuclease family protein [Roseovarius halotolerans]RKT32918.1 nuclease-like protein [Roseovarius halotolerans]SLN30875.1 Succinoglycan biosynthesis protein ExoI [Roseovarius halotolerans]